MLGLFVLSVLALVAAIGFVLLLAVGLIMRLAVGVVLLPFRLLFYVFFFPLLLLKWTVKAFVGLLLLPLAFFVLILGVGGVALAGLVLFVPLLPLLLLGALIWVVIKATRPAMPALRP